MDKDNKAQRKALYPGINFLGSADWAVDLQTNDGDNNESGGDGSSDQTLYIDPAIWGSVTPRVTAPPGVTLIWPPMPLSAPTTITFPPWTTSVSYSSLTTRTSTGSDGSATTSPFYVYITWQTVLNIPPVTTTEIPVWGVTLDESSTEGVILLTSSIQPPPFTITVTPVVNGSTSVLEASETTTTTPIPIFWGTRTYTPPIVMRTEGRSTTVVGGVTMPAGIITVTPNPHPMTTPTPKTTDPVLNSRQPSWTSGTGAKIQPTAKPGCKGCGTACKLFCDSLCPFCPPGIFGNPRGGGSSGSNPNDPDEDPDHPHYTVLVNDLGGDEFPLFESVEDLEALEAGVQEWFISGLSSFELTKTITTTKKRTTSTTTVVVPGPEPPRAKCDYWYELSLLHFRVSAIKNWAVEDRGRGLHDNENGCGALSGWSWYTLTENREPVVDFDLPLFMKEGCVERAIASAGGPKIECKYNGFKLESVDGEGQGTSPIPFYVPMDWSKESLVSGAVPAVPTTSWSVPGGT
ncbi:glycoside hydrolase [Apiospora kogelbergensis]|uniref:Glycoside hydrolase n=1 Tax=Apiospora kogelbergensis TaxID=1337665 RepID=A0AAW0QDK1_9PEZI